MYENQNEKVAALLSTWMNQKRIPKEDQLKYFRRLSVSLQNYQEELNQYWKMASIGTFISGFGVGIMYPGDTKEEIFIGTGLLILGIAFGFFPRLEKPKDLSGFKEIEEEKEEIVTYVKKKENID